MSKRFSSSRMLKSLSPPITSRYKGWAEMIKKVYEIDPLICPKCGGTMRIVSFIEDHKVLDKIIKHLNLTFKAARPPPPQAQLSMAAEELSEYI